MSFHENGKISFDHIYTSPDPRAYFSALRTLDYRIPQLAKPYFAELAEQVRQSSRSGVVNVLDIGCSYGVNAALLKFNMTMDELYDHYCDGDAPVQTRDTLLVRDRALAFSRDQLKQTRFIGLDVSQEALSYARQAGFIDRAVHIDLETSEPTAEQREHLASADLVISTGCIGYVGEHTISQLVRACGERLPFMAHFVLRMYPFEPMEKLLIDLGYNIVRVESTFRQRRFASAEEKLLVLRTLSDIGIDPRGVETDGWLHAQLYVCRPPAA